MKEKEASQGRQAQKNDYRVRLKDLYLNGVVPEIMKRFSFKSRMQVPRLEKIVINMGVSDAKDSVQNLDVATEELAVITGQRPQIRRARKSISNFKIRQGMPIGLRVTLRGNRMYEFMDRFVSTACPRLRDFRGLAPSGFDGRGNYNLGLREQYVFPEVNLEKSNKVRGMNITFVTTAPTDDLGREVLSLMGMPFRKKGRS